MVLCSCSSRITARCTSLGEEVERGGLIVLDAVPVAFEVERRPSGEVVLVLRLLRPVLVVAVVDRLGVADVIDADDQRPHVRQRGLSLEGQHAQHDAHQRKRQQRDFEVGVGDERISVLLEIALGGARQRCCPGSRLLACMSSFLERARDEAHCRVMARGRAGEDRGGDRRNLDQDEDVDHDQQQQDGEVLRRDCVRSLPVASSW